LLQAMRVRPSRTPYLFALVAAFAWIGGVGALVWWRAGADVQGFAQTLSPLEIATLASLVVAPVLLFLLAAMLSVRSQEMKLVARAVGEVAIRLAQPDQYATDAVMNVSRAVRREVAAVGDGLERASPGPASSRRSYAERSPRWSAPIRTTRCEFVRSWTSSCRSAKRSSATRNACGARSRARMTA
jgi:hypothetical protein